MPKTPPETPAGPTAAEVDGPLESTPSDPGFVAALASEYSQYVAEVPITWFGALAFNTGSPVPAGHPMLAAWLADGSVRPVGG